MGEPLPLIALRAAVHAAVQPDRLGIDLEVLEHPGEPVLGQTILALAPGGPRSSIALRAWTRSADDMRF